MQALEGLGDTAGARDAYARAVEADRTAPRIAGATPARWSRLAQKRLNSVGGQASRSRNELCFRPVTRLGTPIGYKKAPPPIKGKRGQEEEETATRYFFTGRARWWRSVAFAVFLAAFLACFLVDFAAAGAGLVRRSRSSREPGSGQKSGWRGRERG